MGSQNIMTRKDLKIERNANLIERYIDEWNCLYIYNPSNAKLFHLNFTALFVWKLIASCKTLGDLRNKWLESLKNSSIPENQLLSGLEKILNNFNQENLIIMRE